MANSDKPRSCVMCARRKVRCDKRYPCGRCQRAGVTCVQSTEDRRPRWVRNQDISSTSEPNATSVDQVLSRLKHLEGLVKDLSAELEDARAAPPSTLKSDTSHLGTESINQDDHSRSGRIILDDSENVRYVSSGFWSRIDSELERIKDVTRGGEVIEPENAPTIGYTSSQQSTILSDTDRRLSSRHGLLFNHDSDPTNQDLSSMLPMASQIAHLLEIYSERVHLAIGLPHMPSFRARLRPRPGARLEGISPSEEALMFSVFYAATASLDEEEVSTSFNISKDELLLKYRIAFERALGKADFLNNPSDIILQSLNIFLSLARRVESPKFVWMLTGLAIRMGNYLGMHHDGSESPHITPFQVEMQRRIWSDLHALDLRVTEDQGTDLAILRDSYTTQRPALINDSDIWPEMKQAPQERRHEVTDTTILRLCHESARTMQDMTARGNVHSIEDHDRCIDELRQRFEREFFDLTDQYRNRAFTAIAGTMRVNLARLTLLTYPPILSSSPNEILPHQARNKLLIAAIEVTEHTHALNSHPSCQPWRWIYQTQQHWHAIIYALIEICRRPWTSTVERAWMSLQSPWLVPGRMKIDRDHNLWIPVRKLMALARRHRESELVRLQLDLETAARLENEDRQQFPAVSSSLTFPSYFDTEKIRGSWRQLIYPSNMSTAYTTNLGVGSSSTSLHQTTTFASSVDSRASSNTMNAILTSDGGTQQQINAASTNGNDASQSGIWRDSSSDVMDIANLDTLLNTDMRLESFDRADIDEVLNFDWSDWIEAAKGF